MAEGKSFRLGDEVRYIQRRLPTAMGASSPLVSLFLFSTETGDAWLLDPSDRRAARLAGDGDPEPVHIEENDTCFVIDWKGNDRIEGPAFIYSDRQTRRVSTILGYVLKFQISLASLGLRFENHHQRGARWWHRGCSISSMRRIPCLSG